MNEIVTVATPGSVQRPGTAVRAEISGISEDHLKHDIEKLAYFLWCDRGCPTGSPEFDWFEAEHRLRDEMDKYAQREY